MLQYDEAVEVHRAPADDAGAPDQFLWRGRLWRVCAVRKHWVESAAWWQSEDDQPGWGPDRTVYRVDAGSAGTAGRRPSTSPSTRSPAVGSWSG